MPETAVSKRIESFVLSLADIQEVGVEALHALSLSVRWPHRAEDWRFLRERGHGLAALDDIGRVLATAMWFPQDKVATVGMVITSPRLQTLGAGHWLMEHVLERVNGRRIALNATRAAERLYDSLGFGPDGIVQQHQGEARALPDTIPPPAGTLRALGPDDLTSIQGLDGQLMGYDRAALLAALMPQSAVMGLFRDGALASFAFCRGFGRGTLVGPVAASRDDDAMAVVMPHLAAHRGGFVRLDTRRGSGAFGAFLEASGLPLFDTVTAMSIKEAEPRSAPAAPYGLVTQAIG